MSVLPHGGALAGSVIHLPFDSLHKKPFVLKPKIAMDTTKYATDDPTGFLSLPDELLICTLWSCTVDSLLNLLLTNKRLHRVSTDILSRYVKALDKHGLNFLPHQAGTNETVQQLQETLEKTAASWINCKFKRRASRLREVTGTTEVFVFDDQIMTCKLERSTRTLALFSLDATYEDPVGQSAKVKLQVGSRHTQKNSRGPVSVECYDAGQDLLAFVHARRSPAHDLDISLFSLRSLGSHPLAIGSVLSIPSHFVRGEVESVFICGRSIALFLRDSSAVDSIILIRWRGTSIFPAIYKLGGPSEQILHMAFLDEDHPIVLTAPRSLPSDEGPDGDEYKPMTLRLLGVEEVFGSLSNAMTAYTVSYLSEGPHFIFPPLKPNAYIDHKMSWILPYHPVSACISKEIALQFKPSPYSEPASHAGVFVVHTGGSIGTGPDTKWQIQTVILKSDLLPWRDQPKMDVQWDNWGPDSTRIFQPRPEVDPRQTSDPLKMSFITWAESYRTASIAFDRLYGFQTFHLFDFNPNTIQHIKETGSASGKLVTDPWVIGYDNSPFVVNVETFLPFYAADFDLGEAGIVGANGEPSMVRVSSTGVFFERDDTETDSVIVGYCWIEDGTPAFQDTEPENVLAESSG